MTPSTVASSSESGNTIAGDLPPSSRVTGTIRSAAAARISLPTPVEPVKVSFATSGCFDSGTPTFWPEPVSTLSTPAGRISCAHSASWSTASGASSAVLRTRVLPIARAIAIFNDDNVTGAFHGTIPPTTPSGSRTV